MSWENIIKVRERKDELIQEIDADFSALAGWGRFFDEMGAIDDLANALIDALNENQGEWKQGDTDYSDMGAVTEYMHEKQLFFFDQEKIKEHIKELKGEKQ